MGAIGAHAVDGAATGDAAGAGGHMFLFGTHGGAALARVCESRSSAQGSDPNCAFSFFRWG